MLSQIVPGQNSARWFSWCHAYSRWVISTFSPQLFNPFFATRMWYWNPVMEYYAPMRSPLQESGDTFRPSDPFQYLCSQHVYAHTRICKQQYTWSEYNIPWPPSEYNSYAIIRAAYDEQLIWGSIVYYETWYPSLYRRGEQQNYQHMRRTRALLRMFSLFATAMKPALSHHDDHSYPFGVSEGQYVRAFTDISYRLGGCPVPFGGFGSCLEIQKTRPSR